MHFVKYSLRRKTLQSRVHEVKMYTVRLELTLRSAGFDKKKKVMQFTGSPLHQMKLNTINKWSGILACRMLRHEVLPAMVTNNIRWGGMSCGLVELPQCTKHLLIPAGSVSGAVRGLLTIWWTMGLLLVGAKNNTTTTTTPPPLLLLLLLLLYYADWNNHAFRVSCNFQSALWECFHDALVATVVKVLCYNLEGRWFDPSWCQWIFHWHKILLIALWPWGRLNL